MAGRSGRAHVEAFFWGPTWRQCIEYWRIVAHHVAGRGERLRCYGCLIGWLLMDGNAARLLLEPIAAVDAWAWAGACVIGQCLQGALRVARVSVAELRLRQR